MLRYLIKRLTNNWGLKIMAVVFAILIWLIVVNVEDPTQSVVFKIPVTIENAGYLTDIGKTYEVVNNTDEISFTISAKRSVISNLSESDFTATANMENIDESMTMVPITVTSSRYSNQIDIKKRSSFLRVVVENLVEKTYDVECLTSGTLAPDCFVAETNLTPMTLEVGGPESVMSLIERAVIYVDLAGTTEDISTNAVVVLLDKNGEEMNAERVTLSRSEIAVDLAVRMQKEIPIEYQVEGSVAEPYRYDGVEAETDKVTVIGTANEVSSLATIVVASEELSLDGLSEDRSLSFHLKDYLPEGVRPAKDQPADLNVVLKVSGPETRTFAMPTDNLTINGLADYGEVVFDGNTVDVSVTGYADELDALNASDIKGTIDLTGFSLGAHEITISIDGDLAERAKGKAKLTIQRKSETDTADIANQTGDGVE